MKLSVVVATYNRPLLLRRLLLQLAAQRLPLRDFEVVVVDDGSAVPAAEAMAGLALPCTLRVIRQRNAGAAAARHRGALAARGALLVLLDDDMQVAPDFLEQHLAAHRGGGRTVVLGRIRADPALERMPLVERWHARLLDRKAAQIAAGELRPQGSLLFTGNVSLRRADYLAAGGFDVALGQSEDIELGMRLEKAGASFVFSEAASSLHGSDHGDVGRWRARARRYGACDLRIGRKHPDLRAASPWRLLFELHPATRACAALALLLPGPARALAGLAIGLALAADRLGLSRLALAATSLSYSTEYFRGVRGEAGSLGCVRREIAAFAARARRPAAARHPRGKPALGV